MVQASTSGHGSSNRLERELSAAVAVFGAAVRQPLAEQVGGAEDQIQAPVANLVRAAARSLGLAVITHAEVPLSELSARPDFAVHVEGATVGYIEVKRPGKGADPTRWSVKSHDGRQWQKFKYLPNLLITDGQQWALYHDGDRVGKIGRLAGDLKYAGKYLRPVDNDFAQVLSRFLWEPPNPPRSLPQLVRASARLCRYLREEIIDVLDYERAGLGPRPFSVLAQEWRDILFPRLTSPNQFADAYAQTVTFALLLLGMQAFPSMIDHSPTSLETWGKRMR
jgi:hypothetical protein